MAYARWSNSSLYFYLSSGGYFLCCDCPLLSAPTDPDAPYEDRLPSTAEAVAHVQRHIDAGHRVPDGMIAALEMDAAENDATIKRIREEKA